MTEPLDLDVMEAAIRRRDDGWVPHSSTVLALIDRCLDAEKARDAWKVEALYHNEQEQQLRARIETVRALHFGIHIEGEKARPCRRCVTESWPCATVRALDGTDTGDDR